MNSLHWPVFLICIALSCGSVSRNAQSQNLIDAWVEKEVRPLIDNHTVDGLSVGYIEGEHWGIMHFGSANEAGDKPTSATVYELGSISKVFTSLLLADAVTRGEIKLDAPAEVKNAAGIRLPSKDGHVITWMDLSTHRSGLPRLGGNMALTDLVNPYKDYDSKKAAEFLNSYELPRLPGEKQEYSNLGVAVLGYLIAEKVGKPYEQLLRERITEPLKLADCTVSLSDDQKKRLATPHDQSGAVVSTWEFSDIPGEGGVHATMRDMMRFAKAQLEPPKGTLGDAIELAWRKHTDVDASGAAMGLGWMIAGDGETHWHNGGTGGYRTALFISRKFNCAAIVLCNRAVEHEVDDLAAKIVRKGAEAGAKVAGSDRNKSATKVSPFTDVQFEGNQVNVVYNGQNYQLLELDGVKAEDLVSSSKKMFGDLWQKRISEDLAELLMRMGHRPGNTVKLRLRDVTTKQDTVVDSAPMTEANRAAIFAKRSTDTEGNKTTVDAALRGRLVGRYQLAPDFIFDVQDKDGHLMVGITNQPTQEVFPDTPTRWSYHGIDATLEFKLLKTGPAKNLVLHQNGLDQTAFRIEDKAGGHDKVEVDAKTRGRLVGRYQLAPNFIFDVQDKDGHLMVGVTNQPTAEVFPDSATKWSYHVVDASLEFKLPKTGPAKSLILHQSGIEQTARRIEDAKPKATGAANDAASKLPIDAELRGRLVGRYQLAPNVVFDVQDKDGHLMVGVTNQPTAEVFPDSATKWSYHEVEASLEFKLPKKGHATSLVLHQNGVEQTAKRIE